MIDEINTAEDTGTNSGRGSAFRRRSLLRGGLAAAALGVAGTSLAGCATGGSIADADEKSGGEEKTDQNPFGLADDAAIEAVIFNGGYGVDYAEFTAERMKELHPKLEIEVSAAAAIGQELQPRFTGGNPPDMFNNSGSGSIALRTILDQVEDLNEVVDAANYEGTTIRETLYPGAIEAGTYDGKFAELPYVMSVFTPWYSASLFEEHGWQPPRSWEETIALGAEAKKKDKYLFVWGKEAATYYLRLCIISAIKTGGHDVRRSLDRLEPDCWSHPAMQEAFTALETCVSSGYFMPGGAGTSFTAAQAQWSSKQKAVLYPAGSWIENEMKDQTAEGFEMTAFPAMMPDPDGGAMPYEAMYAAASTTFLVPSESPNSAGGKEFLRAMLSKEAAQNFAKTTLASTIVKGTVPEDAFGSTALASQIRLLDGAEENTINWIHGIYGMEAEQAVAWNSFLSGKMDASGLTAKLQQITDAVADDDSVEKVEVE